MAKFDQIRERLPSLYRPPINDTSLLNRLMQAVGQVLDQADTDAALVLQSHWFSYADRALHDPFFRRGLELAELPVPTADDESLLGFPYINELAYLGALLSISPWQEPPAQRETVEAYRLRIQRTVDLYRQGLGTVGALARMVETQLPVDLTQPLHLVDQPFWIEETVPATPTLLSAKGRGAPEEIVGPLMRWNVNNTGRTAVVPTLYIQGVSPIADQIDPSEQPIIERYERDGGSLGLAYLGVLGPDETLRVRPGFSSWLGTETGLRQASSVPDGDTPANPTAPGLWTALSDGPTGRIRAIATAADATLWVATDNTLWRYDGTTWTVPLGDGFNAIHCLTPVGQDLWIGSDSGLQRLNLFLEGQATPSLDAPLLAGTPVYAMAAAGSDYWLGTANGAFILDQAGTVSPTALQGLTVYTVLVTSHAIYLGNQQGLIQYQGGSGSSQWAWYRGQDRTEQIPEWQPFDPANLAEITAVFLPPVRSLARTADSSLWLGTDRGLARYVARSVRGTTYETLLEAFPDLTSGPSNCLQTDARGLLWIGCDRGLLRYDGRSLWQFQSGSTWQMPGRADLRYSNNQPPVARSGWRFSRDPDNPAAGTWQTYGTSDGWISVQVDTEALRTTEEATVTAIGWTDGLVAERGTWDGDTFTPESPVASDQFQMRYKPRSTEIVAGGIPAMPRLPVGISVWRYLQREPDELGQERPTWTREGRLLLPAEANLDLPNPTEIDPESGRYDMELPPPSDFDYSLFAFNPAARVWLQWPPTQPRSALVRLSERALDPAVINRLWQQIQLVKPVGVQLQLALGETILRQTLASPAT
ncbi:MAG: hypothetical protein ACFB2W_25715 [Leptolyngbyaceae cyanobacterium]